MDHGKMEIGKMDLGGKSAGLAVSELDDVRPKCSIAHDTSGLETYIDVAPCCHTTARCTCVVDILDSAHDTSVGGICGCWYFR